MIINIVLDKIVITKLNVIVIKMNFVTGIKILNLINVNHNLNAMSVKIKDNGVHVVRLNLNIIIIVLINLKIP